MRRTSLGALSEATGVFAAAPLRQIVQELASGRVKDNTAFTVQEERPLTLAAQQAGVVRDAVLAKLGTDHHKDVVGQPVRLVIVGRSKPDGSLEELWLVTDRLNLPAELVALDD